jgi:hypothetical protein
MAIRCAEQHAEIRMSFRDRRHLVGTYRSFFGVSAKTDDLLAQSVERIPQARGVRGGRVIGSSDAIGGYPASMPLRPREMTATI